MPIRLKERKARTILVASILVAVAVAVYWLDRDRPSPDIPSPAPSAFADREVQMDMDGAARRVQLDPRSADAWGEYGIVLRAYRQHTEADQCFRTATELDPTNGRWPYLLGHHIADADPAAAVEWLERATRGTVPEAARDTVLARLAEVLIALGRPAEGLATLGAAPTTPRTRLAAARAAAATGDDLTAAEFLGDLADYPPAARQALLLRAEICRRQGRTSYAGHLAAQAADLPEASWPDPLADPIRSRDHSPGGRLDEAARLLRDGRPVEAEQCLRSLIGTDRADARTFVGLAETRAAQGDRAGARTALGRAIELDPKNLAANYQLGLLHFDTGEKLWAGGRTEPARVEFREAVKWLDNALAVNPDFGKALLLKGAALQRFLGRPDEGLALLRRFVQLRPEASEGHLILGQALADIGQTTAATTELRRAAQLAAPGDRRAADALAKLAPDGGK